MTHVPRRLARVLALLIGTLLLAVKSAACAGPGATVDDELELPSSQVERRADKTKQATRLFSRGIQRLAEDLEKIKKYNKLALKESVPKDLFRFVVVSCLNGRTSIESESDTETEDSRSSRHPFDCPTPKLDVLLNTSEQSREDREQLLELLRSVDAFQKQRDRLRGRLRQVQRVVDSNRSFLADRRAELRNKRERLEERRAEFSSAEWNRTQSRLKAYEQRLKRLETTTDELAERSNSWPERIETLNHSAYFAIVDPLRR